MEFLARIAATVAQPMQPGAARPALPPRFAARLTPPTSPETLELVESDSATDDRESVQKVSVSNAKVEPQTGTSGPEGRQRPKELPLSSPAPPLAATPARWRTVQGSETHAVVPGPLVASVRPLPNIGTPTIPEKGADRIDAHPGVSATRPAMTPQAPRAAPLSDSTVASRAALAGDERPIIHVTIDRIDVRAPAVTPPAKQSRAPRARASSVSLAEYLRGARTPGDSG